MAANFNSIISNLAFFMRKKDAAVLTMPSVKGFKAKHLFYQN